MATVAWSDHALQRMREQVRYIAEQSCSADVAWKWANDIFAEAEQLADFPDAHDNGSFLILIRKRMTDMPGSLEALQDSIRAVDNFPDADPDSPASRALQVSCAGGGEGISS